jgi:hypothetical protein
LNPSEDGFDDPTVIPYPIFVFGDPEFTDLLIDVREEGGVADYFEKEKESFKVGPDGSTRWKG